MNALEASEAAKSDVFNRLAESALGNQIIKGDKSKSPADDDSKKKTA
jgi:hypothetical protein